MITAIIQPPRLKAVIAALNQAGIERVTICDAAGYGRQRGRTELYRGHEYKTNVLRKVALEIIVNDDFVERTIQTLESTARTGVSGTIGDGKVFVIPIVESIRIRDGARGQQAV